MNFEQQIHTPESLFYTIPIDFTRCLTQDWFTTSPHGEIVESQLALTVRSLISHFRQERGVDTPVTALVPFCGNPDSSFDFYPIANKLGVQKVAGIDILPREKMQFRRLREVGLELEEPVGRDYTKVRNHCYDYELEFWHGDCLEVLDQINNEGNGLGIVYHAGIEPVQGLIDFLLPQGGHPVSKYLERLWQHYASFAEIAIVGPPFVKKLKNFAEAVGFKQVSLGQKPHSSGESEWRHQIFAKSAI